MELKDLIRFADEMLAIIEGPESPARKFVMLDKHLTEGEAKLGRRDLVQGRGARSRF